MTQKREKNKKISSLYPSFHMEIDRLPRGMAILVSGAHGIREFTDSVALIRLKGLYLKISGSELNVTVYENKTVEIVGRADNIEFVYDKA